MPRASKADADAAVFGRVVKRLRRQRGFSSAKLAQRLGITPQYLGILEHGGNSPTLRVILDFGECLGVDAGEIIRQVAAARQPAPPQDEE
ncbi:MAG TPA: helix-turn-helix transcriptional regulator [Thermoanaerobaculia bacterium]|jgi:transcriptional regulator with XRE-family HTH domain